MEKVMIYGAGNMGKAVCRLLEGKYEIRCFLDRNAKLWNTRIHHRYLVKNPEDADIDRSCKVVVAMVSDTFYHIKNSLKATGGGVPGNSSCRGACQGIVQKRRAVFYEYLEA